MRLIGRAGWLIAWLGAVAALSALALAGAVADAAAFVGSLFAAGVSAAALFIVEAQSRPSIWLELEPWPVDAHDRTFLRVRVWNRRPPRLVSVFLDRRPALLTRAWVTFLTPNNQPVFRQGHRMRGRWSSTPEPVLPMAISQPDTGRQQVVFAWDPTRTTDSVDIPPGSFQLLDLVMRVRGERNCQGWHNGIIQRPDPPPEEQFQLPEGRYHALITVDTGGRRFRQVVRIVNDVPIEHFRLEPVSPQPVLLEEL